VTNWHRQSLYQQPDETEASDRCSRNFSSCWYQSFAREAQVRSRASFTECDVFQSSAASVARRWNRGCGICGSRGIFDYQRGFAVCLECGSHETSIGWQAKDKRRMR